MIIGQGIFYRECLTFLSKIIKSENLYFATSSQKIEFTESESLSNSANLKMLFKEEGETEHTFQRRIQSVIEGEKITYLLSIQYPRKVGLDLLDSVNGMAFNLHLAPLPQFKGWNAAAHIILQDFPYFGPTLHWMSSEIDDGDLCSFAYRDVTQDLTSMHILRQSRVLGLGLLRDLVNNLLEEVIPKRIPQVGISQFYEKRDLENFRVVTLEDPPEKIIKTLRAFSVEGFPSAILQLTPQVKINIKL